MRTLDFTVVPRPGKATPGQTWRAVDRARQPFEREARIRFARQFEAERLDVLTAMRRRTPEAAIDAALPAIAAREWRWREVLEDIYVETAIAFGARTLDRVRGVAAKGIEDRWLIFVRQWLDTEGGKKIVQISDATRRAVTAELSAGIAAGEGMDALAARLTRLYRSEFIGRRAVVIARTETMTASNLGSQAAARSTGLHLQKFWIATRDDRVRDLHAMADGQTRDMDEPYVVGGDELMFPGDASRGARAGNIVNCRCVEGYRRNPARQETA